MTLRRLLPVLAVALLTGAARAQLLREAPTSGAGRSWELAVHLEPDQVWRQEVRLTTRTESPATPPLRWQVETELRLRCLVREGGRWRVQGAFVDWHLLLEEGAARTEWRQGRLVLEGWPDTGPARACRRVLQAWSEGLRRADLRFFLGPDGAIQELRGLEDLAALVEGALADGGGEIPPAFARVFGPEGVERFVPALEAAVSVPRPLGPVRIGQEWFCDCAAPGAGPGRLLRRRLRLAGAFRERRYRLLRLDLTPELMDAGQEMRPPVATGSGFLELLADSGLTYRMRVEVQESLPDGGRRSLLLEARHRD